MDNQNVRMPVLKRLAEQSMYDANFRREAAVDLTAALENHGYDLNPRETELVTAFRKTLDGAGIDLFLKDEIDLNAIFDHASPADLDRLLEQHRRES